MHNPNPARPVDAAAVERAIRITPSASAAPMNAPIARSAHEKLSRFARTISAASSHPFAFVIAVLGVVIWAICGPAVHYSETWQLWINTSTTILTFLMVFLLQHAQNRDMRALQAKLDELLRAGTGARNELINLESVSEAELERYCHEFKELHLKSVEVLEKKKEKK